MGFSYKKIECVTKKNKKRIFLPKIVVNKPDFNHNLLVICYLHLIK